MISGLSMETWSLPIFWSRRMPPARCVFTLWITIGRGATLGGCRTPYGNAIWCNSIGCPYRAYHYRTGLDFFAPMQETGSVPKNKNSVGWKRRLDGVASNVKG